MAYWICIIFCSYCRLQREHDLLKKFLEDETELKETKEYVAAEQVLAAAEEVIPKNVKF